MKHAFIFGTSIFLSEERTLCYADNNEKTEFLKILSFYHHRNGAPDEALTIDANIHTIDEEPVVLQANQLSGGNNFDINTSNNRVQVFKRGHTEPILDVYQLDEHEYRGLSSHILNEIHSQHPDVVFTIKGDFSVNGHHIFVDGEKLYVNGDDFANGVTNAHQGVMLTPYGVMA